MPEYLVNDPKPFATTIANGAALSGAIDVKDNIPVGIIMPSEWTAASLTFQGSVNGVDFFNLYDQHGSEITVPAAASRYICLPPNLFLGVRRLKIRSGTSGAAVNQGAARSLLIAARW